MFDLNQDGKSIIALPSAIFSFAWRLDGRQLVVGCADMNIYLFDAETGRQLTKPWKGHSEGGVRVSFNQAGDRVVSNDWQAHLRLWEARTGRELFSTPDVSRYYPEPRFYPEAPPGVLGPTGIGNKICMLRIAEGHESRRLSRATPTAIESLEVFPHPNLPISAFHTSTGIGIVDLGSGAEEAFTLQTTPRGWGFQADGAALWTDDDRSLFCWPFRPDSAEANVYHLGPPERVAPVTLHTRICFDRVGGVVAIPQFSQGTLVIHRHETNREVRLQPQYDVRVAAVSPNGRWVATQSHEDDHSGVTVKIWEADTGRLAKNLPVAKARWLDGFTPDGQWLVTRTQWSGIPVAQRAENFLRLWEVGTWQEGGSIPTLGQYFWEQDTVAEGLPDGTITLHRISTREQLAVMPSPEKGRVQPYALKAGFLIGRGEESREQYIWHLALIRRQLAEMGLNWQGPPYGSATHEDDPRPQVTIRVDDE